MDVFVLLLGVVTLLVLALLILTAKYLSLKANVESRARELFEKWSERELERLSSEKAKAMFDQWRIKYEDEIRRDAIERSKSVILGKVTEHLVPYLPNFNFNPKDVRFIGSPVDLIVFDGLDEGELRRIVFVEVKSGKSTLSKREKMVKEAIEKKKVE